jgi:hypothetical protein
MKLTPKEKEICEKYSKQDETGHVRCRKCPLCICDSYYAGLECYATIDGRTAEAKRLKRY